MSRQASPLRLWVPTAALFAVSFLLLAGCGRLTGPGESASGTERAPSFALTNLDGKRLVLDELRGRAVVLNFWASWCVPCRSEMPHFEKVHRAYQDRGVVFVGAAVEDDLLSARSFASALGITYPLGLDEGGAIARDYQLVGLPSTMFISRDGMLARRWAGIMSEEQLVSLVEQIAQ